MTQARRSHLRILHFNDVSYCLHCITSSMPGCVLLPVHKSPRALHFAIGNHLQPLSYLGVHWLKGAFVNTPRPTVPKPIDMLQLHTTWEKTVRTDTSVTFTASPGSRMDPLVRSLCVI